MKKVFFVTGNNAKFEWASKRLKQFNIELVQIKLDIIEPREFEVEEVVKNKAEQAMELIEEPFMIEDTGFYINALNGVPGAFIKLFTSKIGVSSLCKLASNHNDKTTNFKSALIYVDNKKRIHLFVCNDLGTITETPRGVNTRGFGDLMKIHVPEGFSHSIAEMTDEEFEKYEEKIEEIDHYVKFGVWINEQH